MDRYGYHRIDILLYITIILMNTRVAKTQPGMCRKLPAGRDHLKPSAHDVNGTAIIPKAVDPGKRLEPGFGVANQWGIGTLEKQRADREVADRPAIGRGSAG